MLDSVTPQCGACIEHEPVFDRARSFGVYTGNLRRVILQAKFGRRERLARRLGELLVACWEGVDELRGEVSPLIVPVPLHALRQRERGFNQAELLAAGLVRALKERKGSQALRISGGYLRRVRATPPQTGLSPAARRENLRGAFEAGPGAKIRGRTVVVIDDVMTTGSTLSACARALKRAGAQTVIGLTLARATPQFPDFGEHDGAEPVDAEAPNST